MTTPDPLGEIVLPYSLVLRPTVTVSGNLMRIIAGSGHAGTSTRVPVPVGASVVTVTYDGDGSADIRITRPDVTGTATVGTIPRGVNGQRRQIIGTVVTEVEGSYLSLHGYSTTTTDTDTARASVTVIPTPTN